MSSFGETNVNNYNLDSMDNAHDTIGYRMKRFPCWLSIFTDVGGVDG